MFQHLPLLVSAPFTARSMEKRLSFGYPRILHEDFSAFPKHEDCTTQNLDYLDFLSEAEAAKEMSMTPKHLKNLLNHQNPPRL